MYPERLLKELFFIPVLLSIAIVGNAQTVTGDPEPPAPACTVNIAPGNGATGLTTTVNFSWQAVETADHYTLYLGTTNPPSPADSLLTIIGDTSVQRAGLAANTNYYWYVTPKNAGGGSAACGVNFSSFTTGSGLANDHCDNATMLTVTNGYCGNPLLGTLAFADTTAGLGAASCQPTGRRTDVWYTVTIPATGNVTIQTSAVDPTVTDLVVQAYRGSCGSLISVGCDDDGNPAPTLPSALHAKLGLTNRTPGQVIFIRVTPYSLTDEGQFAICAFDTTTSVLPPVAIGTPGTCVDAVPVDIGTAYKYGWATLVAANGDIIAQVYPNGNTLGVTNASFYINGGTVRSAGSNYYLDRNLTLQPQTQPISDVTTRVYFKDSELQALAAVTGGVLRTELHATRTPQTCAVSASIATCGGAYINQYTSGSYLADHFAEYRSNNISTLYLHKGVIAITGASIWTGAVDNLWENASNWSCGRVPDVNTDVIINSGTVTINSAAVCRSISTSSAANITVTPGFSLRVAH
jgi:hypothetical protein